MSLSSLRALTTNIFWCRGICVCQGPGPRSSAGGSGASSKAGPGDQSCRSGHPKVHDAHFQVLLVMLWDWMKMWVHHGCIPRVKEVVVGHMAQNVI